jgi:hypothetical protein
MRTDGRYANYPAVLFRKIKGSSIPLLINLQGTYERLAVAIDSNLQGMVEEFGRRENSPLPVKRVDRSQAPVKEIVWKGVEADVTKLPILRHQELDSGKYITSAVFILRDPKTGAQNAGIYRSMLHGPHEVGFMTGAFQGGNYILVEHRERKQPMHVAMAIGHHPVCCSQERPIRRAWAASWKSPAGFCSSRSKSCAVKPWISTFPRMRRSSLRACSIRVQKTCGKKVPFGEYPRYYTGVGPLSGDQGDGDHHAT